MGLWHKRELDALWQASSFGARHLMLNTRHTGFWVYLLRGPEVHPRRESVYTERPVSAYTVAAIGTEVSHQWRGGRKERTPSRGVHESVLGDR